VEALKSLGQPSKELLQTLLDMVSIWENERDRVKIK
jgi:hypothetical protein